MHVNDLADYVSESGEIAGKAAATARPAEAKPRQVKLGKEFAYVVPEYVDFAKNTKDMTRRRPIVSTPAAAMGLSTTS